MNESWLATVARLVPDVGSSRLKVGEVAAGRNLKPLADSGRKSLEVVSVCASKSRIAGREPNHAIRKIELRQDLFGVTSEKLELFVRTLGRDVANELDLVEFVNAKNAARVLASRARLASKAGRVGSKRLRQL